MLSTGSLSFFSGDGVSMPSFWKVGIGGVLYSSGRNVVEPLVVVVNVLLVFVRSTSGTDILDVGVWALLLLLQR